MSQSTEESHQTAAKSYSRRHNGIGSPSKGTESLKYIRAGRKHRPCLQTSSELMKYIDPDTTIRVKKDIRLSQQMSLTPSCYYEDPKFGDDSPTFSTDYFVPALEQSIVGCCPDTGYYSYGILIPEEFSSLLPPKVMPQMASFQNPCMAVTAEEEALFYHNQPRVTESQILIHAVQSNQGISGCKTTQPVPQTNVIYQESQVADLTSKASSTSSIQSLVGESTSSGYFSERIGAFNIAVRKCRELMDPARDGKFQKAWLLTEVTHWDAEVEKVVLLSQHCLISVKYDFINHQVVHHCKVQLRDLRTVVMGDVRYPRTSFMPVFTDLFTSLIEKVQRLRSLVAQTRYTVKKSVPKAVMIKWGEVGALHNWNPWSRKVPWLTFLSHPLAGEATRTVYYSAPDLFFTLERQPPVTAIFSHQPILVENYAGLLSSLHNFCQLGFNKSRGSFSF